MSRNSERLIDEQINIALETRESLIFQRETVKAFQKKLNDLTNKFPVINSLVNRNSGVPSIFFLLPFYLNIFLLSL